MMPFTSGAQYAHHGLAGTGIVTFEVTHNGGAAGSRSLGTVEEAGRLFVYNTIASEHFTTRLDGAVADFEITDACGGNSNVRNNFAVWENTTGATGTISYVGGTFFYLGVGYAIYGAPGATPSAYLSNAVFGNANLSANLAMSKNGLMLSFYHKFHGGLESTPSFSWTGHDAVRTNNTATIAGGFPQRYQSVTYFAFEDEPAHFIQCVNSNSGFGDLPNVMMTAVWDP